MGEYILPPPVKSLFTIGITRSVNEDEFVIFKGKVMLPEASVAKFFDIPVNEISDAMEYAKMIHGNDGIITKGGKHYNRQDRILCDGAVRQRDLQVHQQGRVQ